VANYPQQSQAPQKSGFPTWAIVLLVTGAVGLVLASILAVLAIYGVRKYLANAKTAEARAGLYQISRDAASAFEEEQIDPLSPSVPRHRMCASASRSVPASSSLVRGVKYQSSASEWEVDRGADAGFACLKFSMSSPQYYLYEYRATGSSAPGDGFTATAHGDLDGDGTLSTFEVRGQIDPSNSLLLAPSMAETNPEE
jgi:type IV pilus assembly protein PilA